MIKIKDMFSQSSAEVKFMIIVFVVIFMGMVAIYGCSLFSDYPEDNIIENYVEEVIEEYTGLNLDLTPSSIESN